ncbi:ClpP/crotonase, partial [Ascobolus immersus RN42]
STTSSLILLSHPAPHIAQLTLNSPPTLNALSTPLINTLLSHLSALDADPSIHIILLAGTPRAFSAGADIAEIDALDGEGATRVRFLENLVDGMRRVRKVVIGVVEGIALGGGCELAIMCDLLYSTPTATFSQPELSLGLIPGAGGTQRLLLQLGKVRTLDILLTGRALTGQEACEMGLVARVFPAETIMDEVLEIAKGMAARDLETVMMTKEVVLAGESMGFEAGLRVERLAYWGGFGMQGKREGVGAFMEKR